MNCICNGQKEISMMMYWDELHVDKNCIKTSPNTLFFCYFALTLKKSVSFIKKRDILYELIIIIPFIYIFLLQCVSWINLVVQFFLYFYYMLFWTFIIRVCRQPVQALIDMAFCWIIKNIIMGDVCGKMWKIARKEIKKNINDPTE